MRAKGGRRAWLFGGVGIIAAAFGFLVYSGIEQNLVYFVTPSELLERGEQAYDTPIRLGGDVMPGSVRWDAQALDLRFALSDGESEVEVHSRGAPPQMFRDGMGVVVEGQFRSSGVFDSHNLMVMHSNEYFTDHEDGEFGAPSFFGEGAELPSDHPTLGR
jgi:cytochrome c-type biogenesis protein CcmE